MKKKAEDYKNISLDKIKVPDQAMRSEMPEETILSLIESIIKYGLIHPITVAPSGANYKIIAGHRRYVAYQRMERATIPATIMTSTDEQTLMRRYIENMEREGINVLDEALFINTMMETLRLGGSEVAEKIGRSAQYVSDRVSVMKYHPMLTEQLKKENITFGVARELTKIKEEGALAHYLDAAVKNGITAPVAGGWQRQHNAAMKASKAETEPGKHVPVPKAKPYKEVEERCNVCTTYTPISKLQTWSVCPHCVKEFEKIES